MLSQPAWRRTAPDSSPSHPAGTRPERRPRARGLHVLSIQFVFCCRCRGRSVPRPLELPPLLCLGPPSPPCPGPRPASPLGFPWPLTEPWPLLSQPPCPCPCRCSQAAWKCPGVTLHLEAAPGPARFQLQPWQSEQGWGSSSSPAGQLDTQTGCPRGQGGTGGWQPPSTCPGVGLCPQGAPGLPHSSLALLDSASIPHPSHHDPVGALGSCCSPWPQEPPPFTPCAVGWTVQPHLQVL